MNATPDMPASITGAMSRALIFDIKRGSSEDGPGLRSTVFFKGCPLACIWCHNPEGIGHHPVADIAGKSVGQWITLDELLYRLRQDIPFYRSSGGGVTLSGGEPTMQMQFAGELLRALKADGIHTAIETCGHFSYRRFCREMLPWLDIIYFDLKLMADDESRLHTGKTNRLILDNLALLAKRDDVTLIPRIPLVPDITATEANLKGVAAYLREHGINAASLLPYNPAWHDKAKNLGRTPQYQRNTFMTQEEEQVCAIHFHSLQTRTGSVEHAN